MQRTGHLDPAPFYDLPEQWQMLHIAHTRNMHIGRYDPDPDAPPGSRTPSVTAPDPSDIARWRAAGPTDHDIARARQMLQRPGLPEPIRQLAADTLTRAERHRGAPS